MKRLILSWHFLCFCLLPALLLGTPLDVFLKTSTSLVPIYLAPISSDNSGFTDGYPARLRDVLLFDLHHNGSSTVLESDPDVDEILRKQAFQKPLMPKLLLGQAQYVIGLQLRDQQLSLYVVSAKDRRKRTMSNIPLTGNLDMDRRQIHQMADTIHQTLFQRPGIASSRILFTIVHPTLIGKELGWHGEVWETDYDGHNMRQVTNEGNLCVTPAYLHSSDEFLYVSYTSGQPKILIGSPANGKPRRLTFLRGNQLMPACSRQSDAIAFISDVAGNPDLFIQPYDPSFGAVGKPRQIFTSPRGTQASPTFSPDGKKVAFVSNKDGSPRIYTLDIPKPSTSINNIHPKLISKINRENTAPAWSPDGTKIVYCSRTGHVRQLWLYDLKTGKETQLTDGPQHKENPAWAPDSRHILFNTVDPESNELFLLTLDSPLPPVQITTGSGQKRYPSWG